MKFFAIFLTAVALAQDLIIVSRQDGSINPIDAIPGACRGLGGAPVNGVSVPPGLALQFFDGESCNGHQLGSGSKNYFHRYGNPKKIKSVKVVSERIPTPINADYYNDYDNGSYLTSTFDRLKKGNRPNFYRSDIY